MSSFTAIAWPTDGPGRRASAGTREADGWYVSFQTETEVETPGQAQGSIIGLDRGVAVFAATSDGELIEPVAFDRQRAKLARLQRRLARKTKRSENWGRLVAKIARLHQKIGRRRLDFLHKLSTRLGKSHAAVVLENLSIGNKTRSAKGTREEPGTHVAAKSGLNRAILDQGWGTFARLLEYKLAVAGGTLLFVPAAGSSQECSACGQRDANNRVSRDLFVCQACGYTGHADINAAKVILRRGIAA